MRKLYFIINPQAKNGQCQKLWLQIEQLLCERNVSYLAFFTKYRGNAKEIAESLSKKSEGDEIIITAVGGDGTIHEVINGIVGHPNVLVAYIPGGSGNDFSRGFSIPKNPLDALDVLLRLKAKNPIATDVGMISNQEQIQTYFINNMGVGFDALISEKANRSKVKGWLNRFSLGRLVYVYILLKEMFFYKRSEVTLTIDGESYPFDSTWFVTVSNQPFYGGGMKISPSASPTDGVLDVTVVHKLSKIKLLLVFITVFWGGHISFKEVRTLRGKQISIQSSLPLDCHADGEHIGQTPLKIRACKHVLPCLIRGIHSVEELKELSLSDRH